MSFLRILALFLFLPILASMLAGCDQIDGYIASVVQRQQKSDQNASVARLQSLIDSQSEDLVTLKAAVEDLKNKTSLHDAQLEAVDEADAIVSEGGNYGIAKTRQGIFLVSIEKLEPYLDGYKATLHIGNISTLTMLGGDFVVKWGLPWNTPNKKLTDIWASRKSKKFTFAQNFPVGSYTAIEVALTPAKPEEVKTLNVAISWNRVSLRLPPK